MLLLGKQATYISDETPLAYRSSFIHRVLVFPWALLFRELIGTVLIFTGHLYTCTVITPPLPLFEAKGRRGCLLQNSIHLVHTSSSSIFTCEVDHHCRSFPKEWKLYRKCTVEISLALVLMLSREALKHLTSWVNVIFYRWSVVTESTPRSQCKQFYRALAGGQ